MADTKFDVPIWHKTNLTVEEAAAYSGIGSQKLREMSDSEYCPFVLWNGAKRLIKREKLDKYLADVFDITVRRCLKNGRYKKDSRSGFRCSDTV